MASLSYKTIQHYFILPVTYPKKLINVVWFPRMFLNCVTSYSLQHILEFPSVPVSLKKTANSCELGRIRNL
jgi:hypothetical protein